MKRTIIAIAVLLVETFGFSYAQGPGPLEVEREFNVFTSHNAQGYFKPLFTSIQEGFATNLYHTALYSEEWSIALDLSFMGMVVPDKHRTFNAALPESFGDPLQAQTAQLRNGITERNVGGLSVQPTVYGGIATPVFSAPQSELAPASFSRTVGFAEGNNIGFMPGLPHFQLIVGAPTRTELRTRVMAVPDGDRTFLYLGFGLNQQVDRFFDLFGDDSTMALSLNTSFHYLNWTEIMSGTSITAGAHFSKEWDGFTLYTGAQFETLNGDFLAVRERSLPGETGLEEDSPYQEIREGSPIAFELESLNSFRWLGGAAYRAGVVEFHADAAWAAQPVLSAGVTFWLAEFE